MSEKKETQIRTDVDLAKYFPAPISESYLLAKEFSEYLPDYSLMKLRSMVEEICEYLMSEYCVVSDVKDTYRRLGVLRKHISNRCFKALDQIRYYGNCAVHSGTGATVDKDRMLTPEQLRQYASKSIGLSREALESIYRQLNSIPDVLNYEILPAKEQSWKKYIFDAQTSGDKQSAYIAGRICLAQRREYTYSPEGDRGREADQYSRYLANLAISHFDYAADEVEDARYQLAIYLSGGWGGDHRIEEGRQLMFNAADKGYIPACVYAGRMGVIWQEWKDDARARRYLEYAAQRNDDEACLWMYHLLAESLGGADEIASGLEYLQKAIDLGNADAECELSRLYDQGRFVEKDKKRAMDLLHVAAEHGSHRARLLIQCNKIHDDEEMACRIKQAAYKTVLPQQVQDQKVGRNELCPCGSGAKFKNCCGR